MRDVCARIPKHSKVEAVTCSCPMTSAKTEGRYLRYNAKDIAVLSPLLFDAIAQLLNPIKGTPRTPARADLPLLHSCPGGVQYG